MAETANIASYLTRVANEQPDALAVAAPAGRDSGGKLRYDRMTYRELDDHSDRIARGLDAMGIGCGVRTALMVRPSLQFMALAFGILKAGAVPVMVDPGIGLKNFGNCLATAEPEAFIGIPAAHIARLLFGWGRSTLHTFVTVGRWAPWGGVTLDTLVRRTESGGFVAATGLEETAAIVFTSGSTGPPKGVVYTHGNFLAQVEGVRGVLGAGPGDVDLPTFPLFALFDPALGMTTVIPDMDPTRPAKVHPPNIIDPIKDFGITTMFGSPALLDTVGRYGEAHGVEMPTLKRIVSAGAPVSGEIIERFLGMLSDEAEILTPYGATESLPVAVISSRAILSETRTATDAGAGVCVGQPVDSIRLEVITVSDEPIPEWNDELRVTAGEVGEIVVQGPQVTRSYYRAEHHDRFHKIADGDDRFLHRMGDLGYLDDQNRLWFVGRKSHRVETEGETLYPVPCEAVFNTHPHIYRSALVGVERNGRTTPVLCVELEPTSSGVNRRNVTRELLEIADRFHHTRLIRTILYPREFPVDIRHNAKIKRAELAKWATKKLGSSVPK
jgi:acyl-CoA synthetase (AMP-forming)/AMP-acid ligase II